MSFYQICLQNKSFHLIFRLDYIYVAYLWNHALLGKIQLSFPIEIGIHSRFEIHGFSDVDNIPIGLFHNIDSWIFW